MPGPGLEPGLPCGKGILSPSRLPVSPSRQTRKASGEVDGREYQTELSNLYTSTLAHSYYTNVSERETGLEPATPTLARLCSTN